jgi:peptide/nickel transport system substrate-binding protein
MPSTRCDFIRLALLSGAALYSEFTGRLTTAAPLPAVSKRGGTLLVAQYPEPPTLTSARATAGR